MMKTKRNINLKTRPCVLTDDLKKDFFVKPSNTIYYGRYPYKVTLDNEIVETDIPQNTSIRHFNLELMHEFRDFAGDFNGAFKTSFRNNRRIYITDFEDFSKTLAMYGDLIGEIHGPVSQEHLDLLYSEDLHLDVRSKIWYGLYDFKMEVWASYFAIRNMWLSPATKTFPSGISTQRNQWKTQTQEDLQNFLEVLEAQDFLAKVNYGNFEVFHTATVFFTDSDYKDIVTLKNLTIPDFRTKITKAII